MSNIITDTDFIESYFDDGDEVFSLLYGVLWHSPKFLKHEEDLYIYNLLANLVLNQKIKAIRTAKLKRWIAILERTINKLKSYGEDIGVTVPFCNMLDYPIEEITRNYEFALNILNEFQQNINQEIDLIEDIKAYPIPTMNDMFNGLIEDYMGDPEDNGWVPVIEDEMIRRGLHDSVWLNKTDDYDKNLYRAFVYEEDDENIIIEKASAQRKIKEVNYTDVKRIGVLYYMLKDYIPNNDLDVLIKVSNFVLNKDYEVNKKANNSAYNYIHNPKRLIDKNDKILFIKEQLERYLIPIPAELQ